jgi:hypothetical protein
MLRYVNDGVITIKPGQQTTGNVLHGQISHAVPYNKKSLHLEESQSGTHGSSSETRGRFCDGLGSNIVVFFWYQYYPSWLNYCKGGCRHVG